MSWEYINAQDAERPYSAVLTNTKAVADGPVFLMLWILQTSKPKPTKHTE
jgi:hypothetical protein